MIDELIRRTVPPNCSACPWLLGAGLAVPCRMVFLTRLGSPCCLSYERPSGRLTEPPAFRPALRKNSPLEGKSVADVRGILRSIEAVGW